MFDVYAVDKDGKTRGYKAGSKSDAIRDARAELAYGAIDAWVEKRGDIVWSPHTYTVFIKSGSDASEYGVEKKKQALTIAEYQSERHPKASVWVETKKGKVIWGNNNYKGKYPSSPNNRYKKRRNPSGESDLVRRLKY